MDDPGLDGPIADDAKAVEDKREKDAHDEAEEDESAFLDPSRWWFASTAFPLVAGTFGPMASAFSVCALVTHWRSYVLPGTLEDAGIKIPDPGWLIGINAAQLAIAVISNLALLLNMAKRIRFSVAQPITIVGWYISSFVLVALTATAKGPLAQFDAPKDHVYTQALYYAIFAAGLYFIVATLMVITVWGAYAGHYDREFQLTMSQRTLMLQTISFLVYLLVGATIYSHIEGWSFLDAVYWADFTLLTIGIGDYAPTTHSGRALLFPFAIGGIIILGLVIGSIRSLVLERGKVKLGARMVEKQRQRILEKMEKNKDNILKPVHGDQSNVSRTSSRTLNDARNSDMSERQRREAEFKLMRDIQEGATTRRRWTSLLISATTWLALWFIGGAVFQASEKAQGWSYFEALYFSYTSLLTIGYGDIYPMSNVGKPFFVFWSLLAVPSLTVLISNMGDTIIKFIRDLTLWLGEVTVLPGEQGIREGLKTTIHHVSGRRFFSDVEEQSPGFLGESKHKPGVGSGGDGNHVRKNDPEDPAQHEEADVEEKEQNQAKVKGESDDKNAHPRSRRHYHSMLIKEIGTVMKHLHSQPPRKYTFDEWAWYLALIGEDESSTDTHRKAIKKPKADGEGVGTATEGCLDDGRGFLGKPGSDGLGGEGEQDVGEDGAERKDGKTEGTTQWSWVGHRSPLMANKDEAEWVLDRLTRTLRQELDAMREEELEEEGGKGDRKSTSDPSNGESSSEERHRTQNE